MSQFEKSLMNFTCFPSPTRAKQAVMDGVPTGSLGYPLGTYFLIEGNRTTDFKVQTDILLVEAVNGKKLAKPIGVRLANVSLMRDGTRLALRGYETGKMIGIAPARYDAVEHGGKPPPQAQASWQFYIYFIATSVVEPSDHNSLIREIVDK